MNFLEWEENYNLGVKEIDLQHRGLFDLISRLWTTQYYEHGDKYFFAALKTIEEYAALHFETEERYMLEAHYEKFDEHQREHQEFLTALARYSEDPDRTAQLHNDILQYLHDWYLSHILGTDREIGSALKGNGFK